jgi:hypothetical protein
MGKHRLTWRPGSAFLMASIMALLVSAPPARALPPIASGSNCNSGWVNNAGAMACFTQGEEEGRKGTPNPHYVACNGDDIFCCQDDAKGNQNCESLNMLRRATPTDWIRAILAAQNATVTRLGRYSPRPRAALPRPPPAAPTH